MEKLFVIFNDFPIIQFWWNGQASWFYRVEFLSWKKLSIIMFSSD